ELARHRAFSGLLSASQLIDMRLSAKATACFAPTSLTTAAVNRWGALGTTLDITALGRQEEWEDSPKGYPQTAPYERWIWHDEYADAQPRQWWSDRNEDDRDPADPRPRPSRSKGVKAK